MTHLDRLLSRLAELALPWAAESALKSSLVLALAAGLALALRRKPAAWRHLAWGTGVLGALAMPLLVAALPSFTVTVRTAGGGLPDPEPAVLAGAVPAHVALSPSLGAGSRAVPAVLRAGGSTAAARVSPSPGPVPGTRLAGLALATWGLGTVTLLGLAARGWLRARELVAAARVLHDRTELAHLAVAVGVRTPVRLLASDHADVPLVFGLRRPAIVLPESAAHWPAPRRRAVLLHELAHVKRRDCLVQALGRLAVAAHWFNPLAWLAHSGLRREAEHAADDHVLRGGTRPSEYAGHLLAVAGTAASGPRWAAGGVRMAGGSVERRLLALLDPDRPASRTDRGTALVGALVGAAVVFAAATVQVAVVPASAPIAPAPAAPAPRALASASALPALAPAPAPRSWSRASASPLRAPRSPLAAPGPRAPLLVQALPRDEASDAGAFGNGEGALLAARALELHRAGDHDAASALFERQHGSGHRPATAAYNAACAHARAGRPEEALRWLARSLEDGFRGARLLETDRDLESLRSDPRFRELLEVTRQRERLRVAEPADVRDAQEAALELYRTLERGDRADDGSAWNRSALALHRSGRYDEAVAAWERAASLGSSPATATFNTACAHALAGRSTAALDALRRAVELGFDDPEQVESDPDLASIRSTEAYAEILDLARKLRLPSAWATSAADEAFLAPSWREAAARYRAVVAAHPRLGRARFNLGLALLRAGDPEAAAGAFESAHELGYRPAVSAYDAGCALARAGSSDRALDWLERALDEGSFSRAQLEHDRDLESLRGNERFERLLGRAAGSRTDVRPAVGVRFRELKLY